MAMVSSSDSVVQTYSVAKVFRDFWHRAKVAAVDQLSLEILPHEVFGLLGPNGSGKSTTIKMILGLLYPSRGYIRVFDKPPTDVRIKARIGFLPEETYLYPFLNARETLDYYGRLFRQTRPERKRRIDMLLDMVGLTAVAGRRVGEYSKGMQRRIGLAQALINDPDLLILDEPTSGMDPLGTRQFKDLIRHLSQRGKTVILSSHLLGDVEDVCDRVAVLYGGRARAVGHVRELLSQRGLTQIIAERLSEPTVERIRQLVAEDDKSVLDVSAPRDKLETLFLRIVEQAQADRLVTGGATTGQVAEFLRAPEAPEAEGEQVILDLVSAGRPEPVQADQPAPAQPSPPAVERALLDELTAAAANGDGKGESTRSQRQADQPKPEPAKQADQDVIDALLNPNGSDESKE